MFADGGGRDAGAARLRYPAVAPDRCISIIAPLMREESPGLRSHITLALCTVLHAFTHGYGSLLVPLYILMRRDLRCPAWDMPR